MSAIKLGDYCIIKLTTKKQEKFYLGCVVANASELSLPKFKIKFMKRKSSAKYIFNFPTVEDYSWVDQNEVMYIIETPNIDRRDNYIFNDKNIKKYQILE